MLPKRKAKKTAVLKLKETVKLQKLEKMAKKGIEEEEVVEGTEEEIGEEIEVAAVVEAVVEIGEETPTLTMKDLRWSNKMASNREAEVEVIEAIEETEVISEEMATMENGEKLVRAGEVTGEIEAEVAEVVVVEVREVEDPEEEVKVKKETKRPLTLKPNHKLKLQLKKRNQPLMKIKNERISISIRI